MMTRKTEFEISLLPENIAPRTTDQRTMKLSRRRKKVFNLLEGGLAGGAGEGLVTRVKGLDGDGRWATSDWQGRRTKDQGSRKSQRPMTNADFPSGDWRLGFGHSLVIGP